MDKVQTENSGGLGSRTEERSRTEVRSRPDVVASLRNRGFEFLAPADLHGVLHVDVAQLNPLQPWWASLPRDEYLLDGGRYRSRRHTCFVQEFAAPQFAVPPESGGALTTAPRRAHWQPTSYNALHGGLERWFEPIPPEVIGAPAWTQLVLSIGTVFAQVRPVDRWFIEAHQFRIDTSGGIGRPTPEGAHRDGVDFVALLLVCRRHVRGGETRVFDANGPAGIRFTMQQPWSLLLMDDERVIHETTPIQPEGGPGFRDTLVLTYRKGGFQAPPSSAERPSIQVSSTRS